METLTASPIDDAVARARRAIDTMYAADVAAQSLGIEVLEVVPGNVRIAMTVRPDMLNAHGICHGGFLFALADTALAYACNSRGEPMVAAGASIEFLAPVGLGERLIASARETSRSARHGIYDVAVSDASGEPRAHFRGRCARLRTPSGS
ncbi:MAG TPA: hydroxyphenylacetyl-CoA thioesterase PaaI [Steroidobacteraceae bacterium]|nr:hydroxyphenylacetyl-CoA thioesterase PaaI [Steroidobacteraceae bacterium]